MHSSGLCMAVGHHKKDAKVDRKTVFSGILWVCLHKSWFEDKQAYKKFEKGVLVWKSENMKPYQQLYYFGSTMLQAKRWAHVSYGFSLFERQILPIVHARR